MELNTISGLAIAGVICSVVLSMGVPIALFIAGRVKLKARISSFFIGAGKKTPRRESWCASRQVDN